MIVQNPGRLALALPVKLKFIPDAQLEALSAAQGEEILKANGIRPVNVSCLYSFQV